MKKIIYFLTFILLLNIATAQIFDTTNLTNSSNLYEYTHNANVLLDFSIGIGILMVIFSITFIVTMKQNNSLSVAMLLSSFITLFTAVVFLPLELITLDIFSVTLLICAVFFGASFFLN